MELSDYIILEEIGRGGFGIVYKAKHKLLNQIRAIKIPFTDKIESIKKEIIVGSKLKHQNIVTIESANLDSDNPYIIMEYIEGSDLSELLKITPYPIKETIDISYQILAALKHAHKNNIIHGDIKPTNILITKDGTIKITDFGLAKVVQQEYTKLSHSFLSTKKELEGTIKYMSPEQIENKNIDHRSDIYSFGLILHELLTGQLPEIGKEPKELNPLIPTKLNDIILKILHRNKELRYRCVEDITIDLEKVDPKQKIIFKINNIYPDSLAFEHWKHKRNLKRICSLIAIALITTSSLTGYKIKQYLKNPERIKKTLKQKREKEKKPENLENLALKITNFQLNRLEELYIQKKISKEEYEFNKQILLKKLKRLQNEKN